MQAFPELGCEDRSAEAVPKGPSCDLPDLDGDLGRLPVISAMHSLGGVRLIVEQWLLS